jgi:hypothetical protein
MGMEQPKNIEELKKEIVVQIADLSRLLGMIPSDDITVRDARTSFLKLSILISRALHLDIP